MTRTAKAEPTEQVKSKIFETPVNKEVLALYERVYAFNQRQGTVKTKTRGEVSGGGKKPWRQKGTGRARQGSTRAAQWVHGGIAHGPKQKDWGLMIPSKVRKLALASSLALKAQESKVNFLTLPSDLKKTKGFANWLTEQGLSGNTLVITAKYDSELHKIARNVAKVLLVASSVVNAHQVLWAKNIVLSKEAVKSLEERV